ncbi:MAG: O-methyltransferase [Clostridium sp.]|nr:O-methyltransferase [Prevotella sp.]MCM1428434.1 O-methyltransferase [Clostridium sp.]MCM1474899.1 O-methyltransferase [Muribaculaceae bacterium]
MLDYIESHISPEPQQLHRLVRESNLQMVHGRMCSGHLQGRLLKMMVQMIRPSRILELGTFTGYSALCLAEGLAESDVADLLKCSLTTIEANDELEDFIRSNFDASPYGDLIELRIGEALAIMRSMQDASFDMVFIDADKRSYPDFYVEAKRLVPPGGYILVDNSLWDGRVVGEEFHDPQTLGVKSFNDLVAADDEVEVVILPIRDGLSLIRKRNTPKKR